MPSPIDASLLSPLLALAAAAGAGSSDYISAHAARRMPVVRVAAWVQTLGLGVVALSLAWSGAPALSSADVLNSVVAGISIAVGLAALYGALAVGPIGVTAPMSAVVGAAVPVVASLFLGQALTGSQYAGLALGLLGVALFAAGPIGRSADDKLLGIGLALLAGLGIGSMTIALDAIDTGAGTWPVAIVRSVAAAGLWLVAWRLPGTTATGPTHWGRLVIAGVLDASSMVAFLLALQLGHMAIVAVLTALYPAFTVALAVLIDRERLRPVQLGGLAAAAAAVVLVSWPG